MFAAIQKLFEVDATGLVVITYDKGQPSFVSPKKITNYICSNVTYLL